MAQEDNPYAPPEVANHHKFSGESLPLICVDGDMLVVGRSVMLPPRCIFTNEPVSDPRVSQTVHWSPSFRLVTEPKKARIRFAVGRAAARRHRLTLRLAAGGFAVVALVLYFATNSVSLALVVAMGTVISLSAKVQYLTVQKFERDRFWVRGCGPEFLQSCRDEFGSLPY